MYVEAILEMGVRDMFRQRFVVRFAAPRGAFLCLLLMLTGTGSASAQSLEGFLEWSASAGSDNMNGQNDCGLGGPACVPGQIYSQTGAVAGDENDPCGPLTNVPTKAAFSVAGSVNYGLIEAFTQTSAAVKQQETNTGGCVWKSESLAYAESDYSFADSLMVTSDTLPQGTPVQIKFTMFLSSKVSSKGVPDSLYCNGELSALGTMYFGKNGGTETLSHDNCSGTNSQKISTTVTSAVGDAQFFNGTLNVSAVTDEFLDRSAFPWGPKGATSINKSTAPSVLRYAVEVLTNGASYVAASGTEYPTK